MSEEARHRIHGDELRAELERALKRRVTFLRRRLSAYSSSYTVETLDVTLARGKKLRLVLKDVSPPSVLATAQQVRPHFLYHPSREIEVYKKILNPARDGSARCVGAVNSAELERHWLFLERVEGRLLWQIGDLAHWDAAARWLGVFHSAGSGGKAKRAGSATGAPDTLLRYDEKFFSMWIGRAEKFLKRRQAAELKQFAALAKNYHRVVKKLVALPQHFIHGEFYASNVIVRAGAVAQKICAIDWELAGIGPDALDLAALTAGEWSDAEKRRFVSAYRGGLDSNRAPSVEELLEAMELCQLHLSVQMLGWAEDWSPPEKHAQNWLREALRLGAKHGFV
jgi:Ser/Thr protein kinase RdoA (MazF antagonist)